MHNHPPGLPQFGDEDVVDVEVIEPPVVTNNNSLARRIALQVLYEVDSVGHPIGEVLSAHVAEHTISSSGQSLLLRLTKGINENRERIDRVIGRYAPEFPVSILAVVDRNILRIAIYELAYNQKVPERVIVDEAVELAKTYGAEGAARFINGVLGTITTQAERERLLVLPPIEPEVTEPSAAAPQVAVDDGDEDNAAPPERTAQGVEEL